MGTDKAFLVVDGECWYHHSWKLLESICDQAYLLSGHIATERFSSLPGDRIYGDVVPGMGPMGALATLPDIDPLAAWLILPCDVVQMGGRTLSGFLELARKR